MLRSQFSECPVYERLIELGKYPTQSVIPHQIQSLLQKRSIANYWRELRTRTQSHGPGAWNQYDNAETEQGMVATPRPSLSPEPLGGGAGPPEQPAAAAPGAAAARSSGANLPCVAVSLSQSTRGPGTAESPAHQDDRTRRHPPAPRSHRRHRRGRQHRQPTRRRCREGEPTRPVGLPWMTRWQLIHLIPICPYLQCFWSWKQVFMLISNPTSVFMCHSMVSLRSIRASASFLPKWLNQMFTGIRVSFVVVYFYPEPSALNCKQNPRCKNSMWQKFADDKPHVVIVNTLQTNHIHLKVFCTSSGFACWPMIHLRPSCRCIA